MSARFFRYGGLAILSIALFFGVAFGAYWLWLPPETVKTSVLKVGLEEYYPPFAFVNEEGRHTGFDHEIAEAICARMNAQCELVIASFEDNLRLMQEGGLDLMVAGLGASEERKPFMDFSDFYYRSRTVYIGKPDLELSEEGLRGKVLAAQTNTLQYNYLRDNWGQVADVRGTEYNNVVRMLISGEADMVLLDTLAGYAFLKSPEGKPFDLVGPPVQMESMLTKACVAVRKNDNKLLTNVNEAILALRVSGEYDRITRKYFAFSIY